MKTSPRQALTAAADHLRAELGDTPANALIAWRDQHHPPGPVRHSWQHATPSDRNEHGGHIERVCRRCGLVDEYRPLIGSDTWAHTWSHPDGLVQQRSKTPTPPCIEADTLAEVNRARRTTTTKENN